jgi:hypothetical protein
VFAPILVKLLLIVSFIASMAVRIPTRAMMPMAIISMVSVVLSKLLLTLFKAILIFSKKMLFKIFFI